MRNRPASSRALRPRLPLSMTPTKTTNIAIATTKAPKERAAQRIESGATAMPARVMNDVSDAVYGLIVSSNTDAAPTRGACSTNQGNVLRPNLRLGMRVNRRFRRGPWGLELVRVDEQR